MRVKRLPVDTGPAAWNRLLPVGTPPLPVSSTINTDFLIIGGGFAGLSAARRLCQLADKATITLVDAKRIGEGPAGRNSGFMIDLPHELSSHDYATTLDKDREHISLNREAIRFAREAVDEYSIDPLAFDPCGKVNGAIGAKASRHNREYAKHLDRLDEPYEFLDEKAMKTLTGSQAYLSGLYTPGTVLLQPAAYVRGLANGMANRVSCFEDSPVISLERNTGAWLARTTGGSIHAATVILATNGHIESFGYYERKVFHVMLYASMTRALTDREDKQTGRERWGITPSDPSGTTLRKFRDSGGARIITRNRMSYTPDLQITDKQLANMAKRHCRSFTKHYPHLHHVEQAFSWSGRLCLSRNSAPAFGKLDDGLFSACCQNGLGTTRGTLAGKAIAEMAVQGQTDLVKTLLKQGQPKRLPPYPLDSIGANAFMRWREFVARREL